MRTQRTEKDIKPSEQCGGDVTRTATDTGATRAAAEDAALKRERRRAKSMQRQEVRPTRRKLQVRRNEQ